MLNHSSKILMDLLNVYSDRHTFISRYAKGLKRIHQFYQCDRGLGWRQRRRMLIWPSSQTFVGFSQTNTFPFLSAVLLLSLALHFRYYDRVGILFFVLRRAWFVHSEQMQLASLVIETTACTLHLVRLEWENKLNYTGCKSNLLPVLKYNR